MHKSYVTLRGFLRVKGGNHGASNILTKKPKWDENISIFHLALRSKKVFLKKVKDMHDSINHMNKLGKKHNFGPQAMFWAQAYENDKIDEIYDNMFVKDSCLPCLENINVIEKNLDFEESLRLADVDLKGI